MAARQGPAEPRQPVPVPRAAARPGRAAARSGGPGVHDRDRGQRAADDTGDHVPLPGIRGPAPAMSDLITSPDKVYFAERGETKGDLAAHYERVAEPPMRTMGGRPVLLQRFPEGAGGPSFFQKRVPKNKPAWLQTTTVSTPNG